MKIAFIGLGNMGGPMAHNLHKAGHEVRAFDLSQPARDKLAADGVPIAADAKAAVAGAEVVISMLPASQHVEGLFLGAGELLAQLPAGTLIIDCSTIAAATSRKVAEAAKAKSVAFIDAPVSGGTGGAIAGTLTFMVGGEAGPRRHCQGRRQGNAQTEVGRRSACQPHLPQGRQGSRLALAFVLALDLE